MRKFGAKPEAFVFPDAECEQLLEKLNEVWELAKTLEHVPGIGETSASIGKTISKIVDRVYAGEKARTLIGNERPRMRELIENFRTLEGKQLVDAVCKTFEISKMPSVQPVEIPKPKEPVPMPTQEGFGW